MNKKAFIVAFILVFSFSIATVPQFVALVSANFVPYPAEPNQDPPSLTLQMPRNADIYYGSSVEVNFIVSKPASWLYNGPYGRTLYYWWSEAPFPIIGTYSVAIYLDGTIASCISDLGIENGRDNLTANYSIILEELTRGQHTLKIEVMADTLYNPDASQQNGQASKYAMNISETIHFTVDTPPRISILFPASENYSMADIPLTFTVDQYVKQIKYSLDEQGNVAITGNMTLTELYHGAHNLTVYATDSKGRTGASETTYFNIPEPFPTTLIATASGATAAVVGAGLIVYFKKYRQKTEITSKMK